MKYWLAAVTEARWRAFCASDRARYGFLSKTLSKRPALRRGDVLLCYVVSRGRFVGALTITGRASAPDAASAAAGEAGPSRWFAIHPEVVLEDVRNGLDAPTALADVRRAAGLTMKRSPYPFATAARGKEVLAGLHAQTASQTSPQTAPQTAPRPASVTPHGDPDIPEELIRACRENECVAYVGAGLAAAAVLPTWDRLVPELLRWRLAMGDVAPEDAESLEAALAAGMYDVVADNIVGNLPPRDPRLIDLLRVLFLQPRRRPPQTYALLRELDFAAVLTTNFDDFLEKTYGSDAPRYTPQDAEALQAKKVDEKFFLLKLYGTLDRPETVLVAPAQYDEAVARNVLFGNFIQGLFVSRTLLFIGASLEGISAYLGGLRFTSASGPTPRTHYALVAVVDNAWRPHAELLHRRYGIRVLPFRPSADFSEVPRFLEELLRAVRHPGHVPHAAAAGERDRSFLRRVVLQNIGPFEKLELELDRHWNLILGDNGVGKSAILKAIAVGVCGPDAADVAHRLIRVGQRTASVILETDTGRRYVTKIVRQDQRALVTSEPGRPMDGEDWLALGFSPLRTVTWQPPSEFVTEGAARPTSEDLQPLLRGEADARMDKIKQWLVSLHHRISVAPRSAGRLRALYEGFAALIRQSLQGDWVRLGTVDTESRQVYIETPEGVLPIEAVSQGTTSLLGWLAVVWKRLYDLYENDDEPWRRYALVLVDEIDAHMHPDWQQAVVHSARRVCPNVQVIATTHSPLVVANMRKEQVTVFRRDPNDGRVVQYRPEEDFIGLRADQLLTSPLFGLRSARGRTATEGVARYAELAAKKKLTDAEVEERDALRDLILRQFHAGETPQERDVARRAEEAAAPDGELWKGLAAKLQDLPPEIRGTLEPRRARRPRHRPRE